MALRIYTVHLPTSSLREAMTQALPQLVKEGFSWPAFFLGVIWALWHRLWIEAAALIALFLAIGLVFEFAELGEPVELAVLLAVTVLIGNAGNNWRRESLRRRGFIDAGVVAGPDAESALSRYLDLRAAEARRGPPRPAGSRAGAVLAPAVVAASLESLGLDSPAVGAEGGSAPAAPASGFGK